jgi:hypothetical protein
MCSRVTGRCRFSTMKPCSPSVGDGRPVVVRDPEADLLEAAVHDCGSNTNDSRP